MLKFGVLILGTVLLSNLAFADVKIECIAKKRFQRDYRGEYFDKKVDVFHTLEIGSRGLFVETEQDEARETGRFGKIERQKASDHVILFARRDRAGLGFNTTFKIETQGPEYIDELPSGTRVEAWLSYGNWDEDEYFPVTRWTDTAICTVN